MGLSSREAVIQRLRKALIHPSDPPQRVRPEAADEDPFQPLEEDLAVAFAKRLLNLNGRFVYAENQEEWLEYLQRGHEETQNAPIFCVEPEAQAWLQKAGLTYSTDPTLMDDTSIGVTGCEALIAWSGSVMVSSAQAYGRSMTVYPPVHWVLARSSQLVPRLKDAMALLRDRYPDQRLPSMLSTITGPSRTADIEKTLVLGAHGPRALWVFLLEEA
jgi:L-lactate dehydrogenase complex protein LldG